MRLEFENGAVKSFNGNVDEYMKIKDIINPEWIDVDVLHYFGETIEEQVDNYIKCRKEGFILKNSK